MKKFTDTLAVLILTLAFLAISITATFASALVFKVDLGEFTEELDKDELTGFNHIIYEVDGIYSYHVGEFSDYFQALKASNEFYHKGYNQAEVVAFFNRVSIPMEDAFTLMDNKNIEESEKYGGTLAIEIEYFNEKLDKVTVNEDEKFFTVQIGVFSNQKDDEVFNLEGVIVERKAGELFNYSFGEFATKEEAEAAVSTVVNAGHVGAFVTAYLNGERVDPNTIAE